MGEKGAGKERQLRKGGEDLTTIAPSEGAFIVAEDIVEIDGGVLVFAVWVDEAGFQDGAVEVGVFG